MKGFQDGQNPSDQGNPENRSVAGQEGQERDHRHVETAGRDLGRRSRGEEHVDPGSMFWRAFDLQGPVEHLYALPHVPQAHTAGFALRVEPLAVILNAEQEGWEAAFRLEDLPN